MKREFLLAKSKWWAYKAAPWASVVAVVPGGFLAFSDYSDYQSWLALRKKALLLGPC